MYPYSFLNICILVLLNIFLIENAGFPQFTHTFAAQLKDVKIVG